MTTSHGSDRDNEETGTPQEGDGIEVSGAGEGSPRRGVILEVLGEGHHMHFRVRWDEEHESFFYPGTDHFVVHRRRSRAATDV